MNYVKYMACYTKHDLIQIQKKTPFAGKFENNDTYMTKMV